MGKASRIALLLVSAIAASAPLGGAVAQAVPGSAQPEHLEQRFERPARPRKFLEPEIPEMAKPLTPEEAKRTRFTLSGVDFEGVTVYDQAVLASLYEKHLATEISLADIYRVANALTARYRADGYILSRAYVPAQKVGLGIVRIVAIEGFVDRVVVRGEVKGRRGLIESMAGKITESRPLNKRALERYGLLINDLPGVTARTSIRRSERAADGYELVLTFKHEYVNLIAIVDSRGDDSIGPFQFLLGAGFNSLLGLYERTQIRLATVHQTSELRYVGASHDEYLGSEGTKFTIEGSYTASRPGSTLMDNDGDSRIVRGQLSVRHPIIRTRKTSLFASGSFMYRNSVGDEAGVEIHNDRLRVFRGRLNYIVRDGWGGRNRITFTGSKGVDFLDASPSNSTNRSRRDGESDFGKFNLSLARSQSIGAGWSMLATAKGQKSIDALLASEEMTVGGSRFGRAFDPAEISGEDGGALNLEFRYTRTPNGKIAQQYYLYSFFDAGSVWNFDTADGGFKRETLMSIGLGFRIRFAKVVSLYVEGAQAVHRDVRAADSGLGVPRFFFGVTARY